MPIASLIDELAEITAKRLGGNLRLLALYGSAVDSPLTAQDLDFVLVVDAVENCVTHATRDCRDRYPSVQFFVLSAAEYASLPAFFRFQFAFARFLGGDLTLPIPTREDAAESVRQGFTDTLHTLRRQFKRREWAMADDWAVQVWWHLKSFKYATLDACWLLRRERPTDSERAALILEAQGLTAAAQAVTEWPDLETAARQLKTNPLDWILRWEKRVAAAYEEIRPILTSK